MGQQFCSQGNNFSSSGINVISPHEVGLLDKAAFANRYNSNEENALEVAQMIAQYRTNRNYESTASIAAQFDVKPSHMQEPPNVQTAVHKTTGMVRRLMTVRKPVGAEYQERLKTFVRKLQGVRSDVVARTLDVFEDHRSLKLVTEQCTGGTLYDRILNQQYFAEQESAMLVRHVLQSMAFLHRHGLSHGHLTPDSFRFHSAETHAALKLIEFGLELKIYLWDMATGITDKGTQNACFQLLETSRIVFCPPELARTQQQDTNSSSTSSIQVDPTVGAVLDNKLLSDAIDTHLEQAEELVAEGSLEAADSWSCGAIAFLLLCGYPPFYAPSRSDILSRVGKIDFSFDPPFWSKISEEAKDFVQRLMRSTPSRRLTINEALQHPWIQSLADTSPNGSMLSSFAQNLRRFYRTSLIEVYAANSLAAKLSFSGTQEFLDRCVDADISRSGFLTATDLRQVLTSLGHSDISDQIGMCFSRTLRHPGESYIDYTVLVESVRVRRRMFLEEDLWKHFRAFAAQPGDIESSGTLPMSGLKGFLQDKDVRRLLARDGFDDDAIASFATNVAQGSACFAPTSGAGEEAAGPSAPIAANAFGAAVVEVSFADIAAGVFR